MANSIAYIALELSYPQFHRKSIRLSDWEMRSDVLLVEILLWMGSKNIWTLHLPTNWTLRVIGCSSLYLPNGSFYFYFYNHFAFNHLLEKNIRQKGVKKQHFPFRRIRQNIRAGPRHPLCGKFSAAQPLVWFPYIFAPHSFYRRTTWSIKLLTGPLFPVYHRAKRKRGVRVISSSSNWFSVLYFVAF